MTFTFPVVSATVAELLEPQPGERCDKCNRRVPKKRRSTSPETKRLYAVLPPDRAEAVTEALDALQAYIGADGESYPRGVVLELLVILGGQQREELRRYFDERVKA
jgi:hypothetical protein